MLFRHADAEQPFGMHVAKILDRKRRLTIVLRGARGENAGAEAARSVDQRGLLVIETEGFGGEDRGVVHGRMDVRNLKIAASNVAGASRLGMWPRPVKQTYCAP